MKKIQKKMSEKKYKNTKSKTYASSIFPRLIVSLFISRLSFFFGSRCFNLCRSPVFFLNKKKIRFCVVVFSAVLFFPHFCLFIEHENRN